MKWSSLHRLHRPAIIELKFTWFVSSSLKFDQALEEVPVDNSELVDFKNLKAPDDFISDDLIRLF